MITETATRKLAKRHMIMPITAPAGTNSGSWVFCMCSKVSFARELLLSMSRELMCIVGVGTGVAFVVLYEYIEGMSSAVGTGNTVGSIVFGRYVLSAIQWYKVNIAASNISWSAELCVKRNIYQNNSYIYHVFHDTVGSPPACPLSFGITNTWKNIFHFYLPINEEWVNNGSLMQWKIIGAWYTYKACDNVNKITKLIQWGIRFSKISKFLTRSIFRCKSK